MRATRRRLLMLWLVAVAGGAAASCGSRTGLFSADAVGKVGSGPTTTGEAGVVPEAGRDADLDALPPIDATPKRDADRTDCPDADATLVYVVSSNDELYSFYPPTLTFTSIGTLACPSTGSPFSMAVDRKGKAFVVFTTGELFEVSTATAACTPAPYTPGQHGFTEFGMGFSTENGGALDRLYVAQFEQGGGDSRGLGTIDTTTFALTVVGPFSPPLPRAELTGTGDGRLFAFWTNASGPGSHVAEVNTSTAEVVAKNDLAIGDSTDAFAFAFWGGDFWIFHGAGNSDVSRFRPADGTVTTPTTAPAEIVGAGVSTCAPQF